MIIIGIDPGVTGALAMIDTNTPCWVEVFDMPTVTDKGGKNHINAAALASILRRTRPDRVTLEQVNAMPGRSKSAKAVDGRQTMGASSAFNFGRSYGTIIGVVQALGIPLQHVQPTTWKNAAGLKGAPKDYARARALELYPDAPLDRKKDIGRADAILIAHFG